MGRTLVDALKACVELRERLIADGETSAKADAIVGRGLAAEFGQKHVAPYRCAKCQDTGWIPKPFDFSRIYGPDWGLVQVASKCDQFCPFLAWERSERQAHGGAVNDLTAAGRTKRKDG